MIFEHKLQLFVPESATFRVMALDPAVALHLTCSPMVNWTLLPAPTRPETSKVGFVALQETASVIVAPLNWVTLPQTYSTPGGRLRLTVAFPSTSAAGNCIVMFSVPSPEHLLISGSALPVLSETIAWA